MIKLSQGHDQAAEPIQTGNWIAYIWTSLRVLSILPTILNLEFSIFVSGNTKKIGQFTTLIRIYGIWKPETEINVSISKCCHKQRRFHEEEEKGSIPSDPPMCFPFMKTCGTVCLPTISPRAVWMLHPSSARPNFYRPLVTIESSIQWSAKESNNTNFWDTMSHE